LIKPNNANSDFQRTSPERAPILTDGQNYITVAWWPTVFPGMVLALSVVGRHLIGHGLCDQLDPTLAGVRAPKHRRRRAP
jgi:ABC-type dipeptide/oligopeptide/nickel transport system permease subunit